MSLFTPGDKVRMIRPPANGSIFNDVDVLTVGSNKDGRVTLMEDSQASSYSEHCFNLYFSLARQKAVAFQDFEFLADTFASLGYSLSVTKK